MDSRASGNNTLVAEYLRAGSYRTSTCHRDGTLVSSVTAEPHRLPNRDIVWLPHVQQENRPDGVHEIIADYGDFRLYEGDWRSAVAEAVSSVPPPVSSSKVTKPHPPEPVRSAQSQKPHGDPDVLELKSGLQPSAPATRSMLDPRCGYGSYVFSYYHKPTAVHQINLSMIGVQHHAAFIENINQGFNTWQHTYNVCGLLPSTELLPQHQGTRLHQPALTTASRSSMLGRSLQEAALAHSPVRIYGPISNMMCG